MDPTVRNVLLLCGALALSNTGTVLIMTVTALAGHHLAREGVFYVLPFLGEVPEKALSTLALSIQFVATMAAAPPAGSDLLTLTAPEAGTKRGLFHK